MAKKQKQQEERIPLKDVEDRFFPSRNPSTFVNRDDWGLFSEIDPALTKQAEDPNTDLIRWERVVDREDKKKRDELKRRRQRNDEARKYTPQHENPAYPPDIRGKGAFRFVKGQHLNLVDLLSNGGQRGYLQRCSNDAEHVEITEELLHGKHLIVCCFFVPILAKSQQAALCHALIETYNRHSADVQMVVVAKVKSVLDHDDQRLAFNHFLKGFPCLAIPFEDSHSRDYLCMSMGLTCTASTGFCRPHSRSGYFSAGLVFGPDGRVLQTDLGFIYHYGPSSFPFTTARLDTLTREDAEIRLRLDPLYRRPPLPIDAVADEEEEASDLTDDQMGDPTVEQEVSRDVAGSSNAVPMAAAPNLLSLNQLLCCPAASQLTSSGKVEPASVSDLCKRGCVAIYLCLQGTLIKKLSLIQQQCVKNNLQFEIVLVRLFSLCDTASSTEDVLLTLRNLNLSPWWVLPFDSDVTRKLWRLVGDKLEDELIFMERDGRSWELEGGAVLDKFGISDWHPFTRKTIVEKKVAKLRSRTLDELFTGPLASADISLVRNGEVDPMSLSGLEGKNIFVCFDGTRYGDYSGDYYSFLEPLRGSYQNIQAAGGEVFYFLLNDPPNGHDVPAMPWLRLPVRSPIGLSLAEELSVVCRFEPPLILAFGRDGRICSIRAQDHLSNVGFSDSLIGDNLEILLEEISKQLYDVALD